jgi:hypothetical protein
MKKTSLSLLVLASALLLAGCGKTSVSSPVASSATPASSQAASSAPAASSSSSSPAVTSSSSSSSSSVVESSSSSSSTVQEHDVTVNLDVAKMVTAFSALTTEQYHADSSGNKIANPGIEVKDDFFSGFGIGVDASKGVISRGASDVATLDHLIRFTTIGAGSIYLECKSGTGKSVRNLYLAEKVGDGFKVLNCQKETMKASDATKSDTLKPTFALPEAATYYVLTTDNSQINNVAVTYDENNVKVVTPDVYAPTAADPLIFDPMEYYPMASIPTGTAFGSFSVVGAASSLEMMSSRTIGSEAGPCHSMELTLPTTDKISFTTTAAMTVMIYAESNGDVAGNWSCVDSAGTAVTIASPSFATSDDAKKKPAAVTFNVPSAGTYSLSADQKAFVFYASLAA